MARQADAEREKQAKIINSEGEPLPAAAPGDVSYIMMAYPSRCSCLTCRGRSRSALTRTPPSFSVPH
jgi:hypothetical protein